MTEDAPCRLSEPQRDDSLASASDASSTTQSQVSSDDERAEKRIKTLSSATKKRHNIYPPREIYPSNMVPILHLPNGDILVKKLWVWLALVVSMLLVLLFSIGVMVGYGRLP